MNHSVQIIRLLVTISFVTGLSAFGYSKRDQHLWIQNYKSCGGKLQSPISISSSKSVALPLPALEMIGYRDLLPSPLMLKNNGHSVLVNISKQFERNRLPYIFGGMLKMGQEYELDHIHFHWGAKNNRGSEHILNGIRFPMEMHMVHRNRVKLNSSKVLSYEDDLAVLGIFFRLQEEDNEQFYPILNDLAGVQWLNKEVKLNTSMTLASLMPGNVDVFYTYKGSLTTPPCNEVVTWIVFPTPVPISFKQINKFRMLSSGSTTLADNYRQLKHIGLRKVYVRRLNPSLIEKYNSTGLNTTNLSWFWQ